MADDSSSKRARLRRLFRSHGTDLAKTQDGSPNPAAASSSASSQGNVHYPYEQAPPPTTAIPASWRLTTDASASPPAAVPPNTSDTALHTPATNASAKPVAEISQKSTDGQTADVVEDLATDRSLWDRAYDALKDEESDRIAIYEDLLSRALTRAQITAPPAPTKTEDASAVTNQIPQHDTIARRNKLKQITELGLKHMEDKKVSATLLGHEIVLQNVVAGVAGAVGWAEDYIKDATKDLPYASIIVAGVSLVLPLLKNPSVGEATNQDGFTYVTSQMRYYVAMEGLLLPEDMSSDLQDDLTERLVDLYKLIIDFQVQTILRFYRSRTKNFFREAIKYDGWEKKLQNIKDGDAALFSRFERAISASSLQVLKNLALQAEASRKVFDDLLIEAQKLVEVNRDQLGVSRDHLSFTKKINRRMSDAENRACLRDLQTTNPCDDKERLEQDKGGLLRDAYCWVLDDADFQRWRDDGQNQLLWIKGDPGKGKTMLLCGIIDELIKSTTHTTHVSFFFCQATDVRINNAATVLRGLIYMLVKQQPPLMSHIRESYDDSGKQCFEGANAWVALSKIFTRILEALCSPRTYLIIDALDECITDLPKLLSLIAQKSSAYSHIKWIVSSRNWPSIEKGLNQTTQKVRLSLELNEKSVSAAVTTYIQSKVNQLAIPDLDTGDSAYTNEERNTVLHHLSSNAEGTFLWVALAYQQLVGLPGWRAVEMLKTFPPGLDALYQRMLEQICSSPYAMLCKSILAIVSVARRPVTLDELASFFDMPTGSSGSDRRLAEIIGLCGSFLMLRDRTIYIVHQSAKDFLLNEASNEIFPSGIEDIHHTIFSRSLQVMLKTLRRDVYGLGAPGFPIDRVQQPELDPLAKARYSCVYWVDHLHDCDPTRNATNDLQDGGSVDKFLRRSYLYWLEALSLLKSMPEGVLSIINLAGLLQGRAGASRLIDLVRDARRFITYHRWVIENSPLQVYASALIFSPTGSLIRELFRQEDPEWIIIKPIMESNWSACLQILEGHTDSVASVAFSSDGKQLASASDDRTVRLWDATTGKPLQTLEGHTGSVASVAFSSDGKQLASASSDRTVRLWDATTGKPLQTLEGHTDWVRSVAFSSDGKQLASASDDGTVRLWDATTGKPLQTLEGHTDLVASVAFSSDGKQLASASNDRTVNTEAVSLYRLRENRSWIAWNDDNILWLPPDYRSVHASIKGHVFVTFSSGRPIITTFKQDFHILSR